MPWVVTKNRLRGRQMNWRIKHNQWIREIRTRTWAGRQKRNANLLVIFTNIAAIVTAVRSNWSRFQFVHFHWNRPRKSCSIKRGISFLFLFSLSLSLLLVCMCVCLVCVCVWMEFQSVTCICSTYGTDASIVPQRKRWHPTRKFPNCIPAVKKKNFMIIMIKLRHWPALFRPRPDRSDSNRPSLGSKRPSAGPNRPSPSPADPTVPRAPSSGLHRRGHRRGVHSSVSHSTHSLKTKQK